MIQIPNEAIFLVLKTLKQVNPGDTYLENYLWHYNKRKEKFFDIYHLAWAWAIENKPKMILEIGVRTGISICQLLSGFIHYSSIQEIVLADVFNDGFITPNLVKLNMKALGIPNDIIENKVKFLIGDSKQTIPNYIKSHPNKKFDWILVDGSHFVNDAKIDLENVKPIVAQGGVIVFDDIGEDGMNLKPVWEEFKQKYFTEFEWHEDYEGKGVGWAIKN